jgi:TPR repeat protein
VLRGALTTESASLASADLQFELGLRYHTGAGVRLDLRKAISHYRQAAEQGHARAQNNLGIYDASGEGVKVDKVKAAQLYGQAAEQGLADALHSLARSYHLEEGSPRLSSFSGRLQSRTMPWHDDYSACATSTVAAYRTTWARRWLCTRRRLRARACA